VSVVGELQDVSVASAVTIAPLSIGSISLSLAKRIFGCFPLQYGPYPLGFWFTSL